MENNLILTQMLMEKSLIQTQLFYEISMSIGMSLDLGCMLKESLTIYLKKLNCLSCIVLKEDKNLLQPSYTPVFSIPRNPLKDKTSILALELINNHTKKDFKNFMNLLPVKGSGEIGKFYYIMNLPGFGLLVLIKGREKFDYSVIKSLKRLNRKLANACISCIYNDNMLAVNKKLGAILNGTVLAIDSIIAKKDPYTAGHGRRVTEFACAIAMKMGLSQEKIDTIRIAGLLHDIGKISVPVEILTKPGGLSEAEFSIIKTHPQTGYEILKEIDFYGPVAQIVYQHHERIDGSGYPNGLSGDDILLETKIISVADVVEAISSHRPYRPSLGIDFAIKEITDNSGKLYDSDVVNAYLAQ